MKNDSGGVTARCRNPGWVAGVHNAGDGRSQIVAGIAPPVRPPVGRNLDDSGVQPPSPAVKPPIVICVGTSHPGNAGAIARGADNFGVAELRFVAPRCDIQVGEAVARAKHAAPLLENAGIFETLEEALEGIGMSVGTTARTTHADNKHLRKTLDIRDWVEGLDGWDGQLAFVFGREDSGLTADEVNLCDQLVTVPTAGYSSLNLAHAVTLLCYEHFRMRGAERITVERTLSPDTLLHLHTAWSHLIDQVEGRVWRRDVAKGIFKKIIGRSAPDDHEVYNIMGILSGALRRFDIKGYATEKSSRVLAKQGLIATPVDEEE